MGPLGAVLAAVLAAAAPAAARDSLFPQIGNEGYDVEHYDVVQKYDPRSDVLNGSTVITARSTADLAEFSLDFEGPRVSGVFVDGRAASDRRSGAKLIIWPTRGLAAGERFQVEVNYRGVPRPLVDPDGAREGWIATNDGAFVVGEPTGTQTWLPSNNTPADKATFDVTTTVPNGRWVIGNGDLVSRRRGRRTTRYRWRERRPMATYLATATNGRFGATSVRRRGITFFDAVDSSYSRDERDEAHVALERQPSIVADYASRYGAYPFRTAGGAVDRVPGVGYALESQSISNYHRPPAYALVAHELAHGWFGNSVTPRDWVDIWLNEGFATWVQWDWSHRADDASSPADRFAANYARGESDPFWSVPPAAPRANEIFHEATYVRGAMTLEALRQIVGGATFARILRRWATEHRYGTVVTADFTALAEQEAGRDLDAFFRDWLYEPRKPPPPG